MAIVVSQNFLSPMVQFESLFFFIDYPRESFLGSKSHFVFLFHQNFLFPVARANVMLSYGVPFYSISFLYVTPSHFFDLKITTCNRPFFSSSILYIDVWMGWMVGTLFFFEPYFLKYFIIFLDCFRYLKYPRFCILTDGWDRWSVHFFSLSHIFKSTS